jgi:hypothetical protein
MCPVQSATHVSGRLLRKKASFTERRRAAFQFEFTFIDSRGSPSTFLATNIFAPELPLSRISDLRRAAAGFVSGWPNTDWTCRQARSN